MAVNIDCPQDMLMNDLEGQPLTMPMGGLIA